MDLMKELIEESKIPRKAAKAVYHRDYLKTKKKPYRKYDPSDRKKSAVKESDDGKQRFTTKASWQRAARAAYPDGRFYGDPDSRAMTAGGVTQGSRASGGQVAAWDGDSGWVKMPVTEGIMDFVKGAAGHVGNQIKQGVQSTVAAGQQASMAGELSKLVATLFQSLTTYTKLKKAGPQQAAPQQQAQQQAPQQQQPAAQSAAPAAFKPTQKPKTVPGKFGPEYQFSSFLQTLDNEDFITEGVWDFVKGAAGHVGNQVKQGVQQTVAAGQEASQTADLASAQKTAVQTIAGVIQLLQKIGQGAVEQFKKVATQACGPAADKVVQIVLSRAQQQGVKLQ